MFHLSCVSARVLGFETGRQRDHNSLTQRKSKTEKAGSKVWRLECSNDDDWPEHEHTSDIDDPGKIVVISSELARLNFDIAALQETRLADNGSLKEKKFTLFWQGKSEEVRREQGVGFAIRSRLVPMVEVGDYSHSESCTLSSTLRQEQSTLYLLMLQPSSSSDIKDAFYSKLEDSIERLKEKTTPDNSWRLQR